MTAPLRPIVEVAEDLGLTSDHVMTHGPFRAKVRLDAITPGRGPSNRTSPVTKANPPNTVRTARQAKYVLVTATSPTKAGEGKTVTSIGLAMGLNRIGRQATVTLRQSSLGPTLGLKGGGAGGGAATVVPLEEALFGLGVDLFAVESANNLLAARIDDVLGHPARGDFKVDADAVWWRRVIDMDDRSLRHVTVSLDGRPGGPPRTTAFDITAASEVMAVLSLARDLSDLRTRLGRIVVAFDRDEKPVTAEDLGAAGAMAALLRDALRPNLLQTAEGTPALVHGGPFANIAHGCSSVIGDRLALSRSDYVVTEAGFGSDLGAEKLLHLKVPVLGRAPDAVVLVTTVRALADHGRRLGATGGTADEVAAGSVNLTRHLTNLRAFGLPVIVAHNCFPDDAPDAVDVVRRAAFDSGAADVVTHTAFADGGRGAQALAEAVARIAERTPAAGFRPVIDEALSIPDKVERLAASYGAGSVEWAPSALNALARFESAGYGRLPVCIAKTQMSFSHDPDLAGAPTGFTLPVRDLRLAAGAGFVTVTTGEISTMPGLGRFPRFLGLDVDAPDGDVEGLITGLA